MTREEAAERIAEINRKFVAGEITNDEFIAQIQMYLDKFDNTPTKRFLKALG